MQQTTRSRGPGEHTRPTRFGLPEETDITGLLEKKVAGIYVRLIHHGERRLEMLELAVDTGSESGY